MGFLLDAEARSLSPHTIADYQNAFRKLQAFLGDPPLESISMELGRRRGYVKPNLVRTIQLASVE
jgi:hypothetical protein